MRRLILMLLVAAVMALLMVASALPALAQGAQVTRCPELGQNRAVVVTPTGDVRGTPEGCDHV